MESSNDREKGASALQREIGQVCPFHSDSLEAAMGLLRTACLVRRHLTAVVEPYGLTFSQYNALCVLRRAGEPLPTMEIASRLIEETPNVTRILSNLESRGLIRRQRCPEDQRQVLCTISPAGLDLLRRIDEPMDEADRASMEGLTPECRQRLLELLDSVRASFKGHGNPD